MKKTSCALACMCFLVLLSLAGCVKKTPVVPAILEDAAFLHELGGSGKKVMLVAASSGYNSEEVKQRLVVLAETFGVRFVPENLDVGAVPYNAADDSTRLRYMKEALTSPDISVIWAVRGGYGSSRIVADIAHITANSRKLFIGYSDATFLHLYFQSLGWPTIHGAMFGEMTDASKDAQNFRLVAGLISGDIKALRYGGLEAFNDAARNAAHVSGLLTGGNLTCLSAAEGTPWALQAGGKILFLEDVKEPGYKIDRMLTQLKNAGKFRDVRAVVFGSFTSGDDYTEYALRRFADAVDVPVFRTDAFGHGETNYPLVFNAPASIFRSTAAAPPVRGEAVIAVPPTTFGAEAGEAVFSLSIDASRLP